MFYGVWHLCNGIRMASVYPVVSMSSLIYFDDFNAYFDCIVIFLDSEKQKDKNDKKEIIDDVKNRGNLYKIVDNRNDHPPETVLHMITRYPLQKKLFANLLYFMGIPIFSPTINYLDSEFMGIDIPEEERDTVIAILKKNSFELKNIYNTINLSKILSENPAGFLYALIHFSNIYGCHFWRKIGIDADFIRLNMAEEKTLSKDALLQMKSRKRREKAILLMKEVIRGNWEAKKNKRKA